MRSMAVMCIEVHVKLASQIAQRVRGAQSMMPESTASSAVADGKGWLGA